MKVLVMGAGAVGAYFGARLQQIGDEVVFCARGANLEAMRTHGLHFASYQGDFGLRAAATAEPGDHAPYDLVLFCVKSYDTESAARQIEGCLAPDGVILTLQNGVENEYRLAEVFGAGRVMAGNARIGAELVTPGKIEHRTGGAIEFGELEGGETDRARRLAEHFRKAGILQSLVADIKAIRWEKLLWNGAFNTVATLTESDVGTLLADDDAVALLRNLMGEIAAAARAEGVALGEREIEYQFTRSREALSAVRPSTLQDHQRGKPLEYEALCGAVVRAAHRHGIAAPYMEAAYALMKLIDKHGGGR
jgi:2-dehydropantoate 2-reductase